MVKLRGLLHLPGDEESAAAATEPELQPDLAPPLTVGMRIQHNARGCGRLVDIVPNDERGKPYHVQYDSGELHCYSKQSALKLQPIGEAVRRFAVNPRYQSAALFAPRVIAGAERRDAHSLSFSGAPTLLSAAAADLPQLDRDSAAASRLGTPATPTVGPQPLDASRARAELNRTFQALTSGRRRWMDRGASTLASADAAVSPTTALLEAGERMHLLPRALHIPRRDASVLDLSHFGVGKHSSMALAEAIGW